MTKTPNKKKPASSARKREDIKVLLILYLVTLVFSLIDARLEGESLGSSFFHSFRNIISFQLILFAFVVPIKVYVSVRSFFDFEDQKKYINFENFGDARTWTAATVLAVALAYFFTPQVFTPFLWFPLIGMLLLFFLFDIFDWLESKVDK